MKKKKEEKQEEEINPTVIDREENNYDIEELKAIGNAIENTTIKTQSEDKHSFYKEIIKGMNDKNNISMKTEYLGVRENYTGTKLEFLSTMGNMPYLKSFVRIFETKRVSLGRKGRKEDVMILQEKERIEQKERQENYNKMFGMNP